MIRIQSFAAFMAAVLMACWRWLGVPLLHVLVPIMPPVRRCRFDPSCSEYARMALSRHGFIRGTVLAICRIARCHPWGACGHDPVPRSSNGPNNTLHHKRNNGHDGGMTGYKGGGVYHADNGTGADHGR